jgi:hypothetical protein
MIFTTEGEEFARIIGSEIGKQCGDRISKLADKSLFDVGRGLGNIVGPAIAGIILALISGGTAGLRLATETIEKLRKFKAIERIVDKHRAPERGGTPGGVTAQGTEHAPKPGGARVVPKIGSDPESSTPTSLSGDIPSDGSVAHKSASSKKIRRPKGSRSARVARDPSYFETEYGKILDPGYQGRLRDDPPLGHRFSKFEINKSNLDKMLGSRSPSELRINELREGRWLYMTILSGG